MRFVNATFENQVLTLLGLSDPYLSIHPPFLATNVSEIGVWSLRGTSVRTKKYIRLTSLDSLTYGGLCSRRPTYFTNWTLDVEYSGITDFSTRAQTVYFTKDLCPEDNVTWNGIAVQLNTTHVDWQGLSDMKVAVNNGSVIDWDTIPRACEVFVCEHDLSYHIKIVKSGDAFDIYGSDKGLRGYKYCTTVHKPIEYGYYSLASDVLKSSHPNDLLGIDVTPDSLPNLTLIDETLEKKNRKRLSSGQHDRMIMKMKSRERMPLSTKYYNQSHAHNFTLFDEATNVSEALSEVSELIRRAKEDLSVIQLNQYMDEIVTKNLQVAINKIEKSFEMLHGIKVDFATQVQDLNANLKTFYHTLAEEVEAHKDSLNHKIRRVFDEETRIKFDTTQIDALTDLTIQQVILSVLGFIAIIQVIVLIAIIYRKRSNLTRMTGLIHKHK